MQRTAKEANSVSKQITENVVSYSVEIRNMIKERRRVWHRTQNLADKRTSNFIGNQAN